MSQRESPNNKRVSQHRSLSILTCNFQSIIQKTVLAPKSQSHKRSQDWKIGKGCEPEIFTCGRYRKLEMICKISGRLLSGVHFTDFLILSRPIRILPKILVSMATSCLIDLKFCKQPYIINLKLW